MRFGFGDAGVAYLPAFNACLCDVDPVRQSGPDFVLVDPGGSRLAGVFDAKVPLDEGRNPRHRYRVHGAVRYG